MKNTDTSFYGKQTDERILYVVRPHRFVLFLGYIKVILSAAVVFFGFMAMDSQLTFVDLGLAGIGSWLALAIVLIGFWAVGAIYARRIGYVTDRRVVKFEAPTPFATRMRSLSWEETVKVKTMPPNFIWKMWMIGTVVVHAKSTIATHDSKASENTTTDDDLEFDHVFYYRDLSQYIEKILFTYKRTPKEMGSLKPFVAKPKGQRG